METEGPRALAHFPIPSSTPTPATYPCELGTQHAKNNFRPRKFIRIPSATESQAALKRTLQKYWGHNDFRGPQLDICSHVLKGCDVLVVAPTGLGKSVCFQVPAVAMEYGITVVVSPLLALMRDQVTSLQMKGIHAYQLSEKTDPNDIQEIKRQLRMGHPQLRLLYTTPETLFSGRYATDFDIAYRQRQIVRLVVDEAHVIDEWGSTFRPTYRRLGEFRTKYPAVPITALTASATSEVRDDMTTILNMPKTPEQGLAQWVEPFNRKNLFYEIRYQGGSDRQSSSLQNIAQFINDYRPEAAVINERNGIQRPCVSGLVYCRYKHDCDTIAEVLNASGTTARVFYASLPDSIRNETLDDWKAGKVECIIATIAFGMGVDQAHVRYVIHYDMPKSFEGYYQETGRAGRDGHISRCVLYYSREDAVKLRGLIGKEVERAKKSDSDPAVVERGKLRMINSFKALQMYAESVSLCRHVSICRYFGEQIPELTADIKARYCDGMCDVCSNKAGVFHRSSNLTEDAPVSSPIIRPKPLEQNTTQLSLEFSYGEDQNMQSLSGEIKLAPVMSNRPTPAGPSTWHRGANNAVAYSSAVPQASFVTPRTPTHFLEALEPIDPNQAGPARTIDQVAQDGLIGAVAVYGEARSPTYAEKKRKAREDAFKGVRAASQSGPFSFYNSSAPKKRGRVGGEFKVPLLKSAPGSGSISSPVAAPVALSRTRTGLMSTDSPSPSNFMRSQSSVASPSFRDVRSEPDRLNGLRQLQEALKRSFAEGPLADRVMKFWSRDEMGEKRALLIRRVANNLEKDIASMAIMGEPYVKPDPVIKDTCDSVKLVRDRRGVDLVLSGLLDPTPSLTSCTQEDRVEDPRVERLRHVATCFQTLKSRKSSKSG